MKRLRLAARVMALAAAVASAVAVGTIVVRSAPEESTSELDTGFTSIEQTTMSTTESFSGTVRYAGTLAVVHGGTGGEATVTWVSAPGTEISSGSVLYEVNGWPIVVLDGATPAYRTLEQGVEGDDVAQLQAALVAAGHDPDGLVDVDGEFGTVTERMVEDWQATIGTEVDGVVDLGEVLFQPDISRVSAVSVDPGAEILAGDTVVELTSGQRVVELDVEADRAHLLVGGTSVDIRLPDRSIATGVVLSVGSVVDAESSTVPVLVASDELGDVSDRAPVAVLVEPVIAAEVFVVEAEAVRSTLADDYVIDVIAEDGTTSRLPVVIGASDGIVVAIEGDGLEAGLRVVAPA